MGQLIPLVETDACAQGVAALSTRLTRLVLHVQKLPGFAREGWNTEWGQGWVVRLLPRRRSGWVVCILGGGPEDGDLGASPTRIWSQGASCMIPLPWNVQNRQIRRDRREICGARDLGEGAWGEIANGYVSFWGDENVLQLDSGDS